MTATLSVPAAQPPTAYASDGVEDRADDLPPGTVLADGHYTLTRKVGSGGFGLTYLARDRLGQDVILKECFVAAHCMRQGSRVVARSRKGNQILKKILQAFTHEARALAAVDHPNIVKLRGVFRENETAYLELEYIDGPDLLQLVTEQTVRFAPDQIVAVTCKLVSALDYLHQAGMLHGDISPDNVCLTSGGEPILIDFGAVRTGDADKPPPWSGFLVVKDGYSPHESYLQTGQFGPWSDIYALGASIYHLITGTVPVDSQTRLVAIAEGRPDVCLPLAGRVAGYPPGFLESIDTAMGALPKARHQTARAWLADLDTALAHRGTIMQPPIANVVQLGAKARGGTTATPAASPGGAAGAPAPTRFREALKGTTMAIDLSGLKDISGFIAGCLVDAESGLVLASEQVGTFDLDTAAAANVEVVRAKNNAMRLLGLNDSIEDILITLTTQLHLIRPMGQDATMFVYVALDRKSANLGLARAQVKKVEQGIKV